MPKIQNDFIKKNKFIKGKFVRGNKKVDIIIENDGIKTNFNSSGVCSPSCQEKSMSISYAQNDNLDQIAPVVESKK